MPICGPRPNWAFLTQTSQEDLPDRNVSSGGRKDRFEFRCEQFAVDHSYLWILTMGVKRNWRMLLGILDYRPQITIEQSRKVRISLTQFLPQALMPSIKFQPREYQRIPRRPRFLRLDRHGSAAVVAIELGSRHRGEVLLLRLTIGITRIAFRYFPPSVPPFRRRRTQRPQQPPTQTVHFSQRKAFWEKGSAHYYTEKIADRRL
jgi:hypothetical protein